MSTKVQTLNADSLASLPLSGRHLIEASAGTGKTYNITKLYVRLLVEKGVSVQQILVMTFTKAATEELRGRIEREVREVYERWDCEDLEGRARLQRALLDMDEAAIFTIHGFRSRVLGQEAFASGLPMALTMEAETDDLLLQSVQDWFRGLGSNPSPYDALDKNGWQTPDRFYQSFGTLLRTDEAVETLTPDEFQAQHELAKADFFEHRYKTDKKVILQALNAAQSFIFEHLVVSHKEANKREQEWQTLLNWLENDDAEEGCPKEASAFYSGARYSRKETRLKSQLNDCFDSLKNLVNRHRADLKDWESKLAAYTDAQPAYEVVKEGIRYIRQSFGRVKQKRSLMDFNDLINHLSCRLNDPEGAGLVDILRAQYPIALVDEFQDTDPLQYAILNRVYPKGDARFGLFMIGDPKQAIYSFRGGDVYAYLLAKSEADYHWHMDTNWRSVASVVSGYNRIFYGRPLSEKPPEPVFGKGIDYDPILASPMAAANDSPLFDPEERGAITFYWLPEIRNPSGKRGEPVKDDWMRGLTAWCVGEIDRLLSSARLGDEPLKEKDVAILVRSGKEADMIREAMRQAGYPSVYLSDRTNVYESEEAIELLRLLTGILECENDRLLVSAIATRCWGGDAALLAQFKEDESCLAWEEAKNRASSLRDQWRQYGCMDMLLDVLHHDCRPDPSQHERNLTNWLHLIEQLQQASRKYRQPQQLLKWFRDQCLNPVSSQEAEQRLESDDNLIRIVTQHKSKGLEYPIVFVPYATTYRNPVKQGSAKVAFYKFRDGANQNWMYQLGPSEQAVTSMVEESHLESIRLFYVAMTRASHRCYIGGAPIPKESEYSSLAQTLQVRRVEQWQESLSSLAATADDSIRLLTISDEPGLEEDRVLKEAGIEIGAPAKFDGRVDDSWKLMSYSMMKRNAFSRKTERQEQKDRDEEGNVDIDESQEEIDTTTLPLRFRLAKGSHTGDLLHDILEHLEFDQANWSEVISQPLARFDPDADIDTELENWLSDVLQASMPLLGDKEQAITLQDLPHDQTLREAEFYFPMGQVDVDGLETLILELRGTHETIHLSRQDEILSGMMHGYIDLIFEHQGKYYVADYKSTHLGNQLEDYLPEKLAENIYQHFYDLQYLIYSLALHRYLRQGLPSYDPDKHFGGVYYFYLRGMSSRLPSAGIYAADIAPGVLERLDTIFGDQEANV